MAGERLPRCVRALDSESVEEGLAQQLHLVLTSAKSQALVGQRALLACIDSSSSIPVHCQCWHKGARVKSQTGYFADVSLLLLSDCRKQEVLSVDRLDSFPWLWGPYEVSESPKSFVTLTEGELQVQKYRARTAFAKHMALKNKLMYFTLPSFSPDILGVNLALASPSLQVPSSVLADWKAIIELANSSP